MNEKSPKQLAKEAYEAMMFGDARDGMRLIEEASWNLGSAYSLFNQEFMRLIAESGKEEDETRT